MTSTTDVPELIEPADWDFGDFAYGLEPLTLPPTRTAEDRGGLPDPAGAETADTARWLTDLDPCARAGAPLASVAAEHQLYWFRWITGHQATFALWQVLADAHHAACHDAADRTAVATIAELARAYTSMLLYTSSCSHEVYHAVIRPSMFLQHRGFSGTWAPDFAPLRWVLRGRPFDWSDTDEGAQVTAAVREYGRVHAGVAAKLVPGGRSLLKQAVDNAPMPEPEMRAVIYDNYFLTLRDSVPRAEVAAQLVRRLKAIALDVGTNGLYPGQDPDGDAVPRELRKPEVVAVEEDFTATLGRVAGLAAGITVPA